MTSKPLPDYHTYADRIARELLIALKSGRIDHIGGELIETTCDMIAPLSGAQREWFVMQTITRVIELVSER
jgi:hypothetical protein